MAHPIYAYLSDEIGINATLSLASGTADAFNPLANLKDRNPAVAFITSSSGTAVDIRYDHGSAKQLDGFSLHGLNVPAGTNVRVMRAAVSDFSVVGLDAAVPIETYPNDGLPLPTFVDLRQVSGHGGATGYRYTRLYIPSLAQLVGLGSTMLWQTLRQDIRNVRYPVRDVEVQPSSRPQRTAYGGKRVKGLGVRLRAWPCAFRLRQSEHGVTVSLSDFEAMVALFRACRGQANGFLWVRDPTSTDARFVSFDRDVLESELVAPTVHDLEVGMDEYSLGLALPTA